MQIELANSIGNQTKIPKHFSLKNSQKVYLGKKYIYRGKIHLKNVSTIAVASCRCWPISCHKSSRRNDRRRLVSESQSPARSSHSDCD